MARNEGFKYWSDQEFVQGFDTNAYLMSQSVMRFDNSADRDSALARTLTSGMLAYDKSTTTLQLYDGSSWVDVAVGTVGVTDHGALTGLSDDDHSQYHNDARGDARYYTQSQVNSSLSGYLPLTGGSLSGDLQFSASSGSSNIEWTGATGPMGLKISPGGTLESALYYRTSPDTWSFENASGDDILTIDIDDQRVGIGTDSPDNKLHVQIGTSAAPASVPTSHMIIADSGETTDSGIAVYSSTTGNGYFRFGDSDSAAQGGFRYEHSADKMYFRTGGTDRGAIDSSGNVGIGTDSPSAELDIKGASNPEIRLQSTDSTDPFLYFGDQVDAVRGGIGMDTSANALQLRGYNNSTRMTIDSSGNVGINDTTPSYTLDVNGTGRFTGTLTLDGDLTGTSNSNFFVGNDSNERILFQESSNRIFFMSNGSYRWYIDNNGDLLPYTNKVDNIGTSSLRVLYFYGSVINIDNEIQVSDGSATDPPFTFSSDGNTGIYRYGSDSLGITCGGVVHRFATDGLHLASGDWFRSYGSTGWYNQTYGGGWNMQDSTWVRVYNNKRVFTGTGLFHNSTSNNQTGYNATFYYDKVNAHFGNTSSARAVNISLHTTYSTDYGFCMSAWSGEANRARFVNRVNNGYVNVNAAGFTTVSAAFTKERIRTARDENGDGLIDVSPADQNRAFELFQQLRPVIYDDAVKSEEGKWLGCDDHETRDLCADAECWNFFNTISREHDCDDNDCAGTNESPCAIYMEHYNKLHFIADEVDEVYPHVVSNRADGTVIGIDHHVLATEHINVTQHLIDAVAELQSRVNQLEGV